MAHTPATAGSLGWSEIKRKLGQGVRVPAKTYLMCPPDYFTVSALAGVFDDLIEAKDSDAEALGLNAVSDGRHVVLAARAVALADRLAAAGFQPVGVDMSEFAKAGGGAKCCTLELRHSSGEAL